MQIMSVIEVIPALTGFGFQSSCSRTPDWAGKKENEVKYDMVLWLWKAMFYVHFGQIHFISILL